VKSKRPAGQRRLPKRGHGVPKATSQPIESRVLRHGRPRQGLPPGMLKRIDQYLVTCFRRETAPRVAELVRLLQLNLSWFVETFHRATGSTPSAYLKQRQIGTAKLLLQRTAMAVDRVGYAAGFGTRRTFFREIRKHAGMSPASYRKRRTKCP
jgi:AraC-like DNA-binding protein